MADEQNKPDGKDAEKVEPAKKPRKRDYSQRAHDLVREVEKRHEERHKDDPAD